MNELRIEVAENGFVVYEGDDRRNLGMIGKKWAFETAESLSGFVLDWGKEIENTKIKSGAKEPKGVITQAAK